MEKGGDQGFDFENYYKVLSIKYESLIREDSEARKNGENEKKD